MNKRIEELLGQAYDEAVPETWTTLSSEQLGRIYEKFAELIVRECVNQVRDEVQYEYDWKLADAVTKRVMEHFGVEL